MILDRLAIVLLGAFAMCATMLLRDRQFPEIAIWKKAVLTGLLTVTSVLGMLLLWFVETGTFGGASFYGAMFLIPILIFPARFMKITDRDALNLCAPAGCAMLVVMQFDCLYNDCCLGKYLPDLEFQFPSQIAEMVVGVGIMAILMWMHTKNRQAQLYPWFMILYGICRAVLQCFRYGGTKPWLLGLSHGRIWSLISVAIGMIWLVRSRTLKPAVKKNSNKKGKKKA